MRRSTCRGCGAEIIFITTGENNGIPCNPEPLKYWLDPEGRERIVTTDGKVVRAELEGMPGFETGTGYISHFATCPMADSFRKSHKSNG